MESAQGTQPSPTGLNKGCSTETVLTGTEEVAHPQQEVPPLPRPAAASLPDDLQLRAALGLVCSLGGGLCLVPGSRVHRRGVGRGWHLGPVLVEGVVALRGAPSCGPATVGLRGGGARAAERVRQVPVCRTGWKSGSAPARAPGHSQIKPSHAPGARGTVRAPRHWQCQQLLVRMDREASVRPCTPLCSSENAWTQQRAEVVSVGAV